MAVIRPFRALRPAPELAERVAALPYDVMNVEEARGMAEGNPYSFLHISRPEIDLPEGTDSHDEPVYIKGRENLDRFVEEGILRMEEKPCYYVYRQTMGSVTQTGLVVCASVDDYQQGAIKKHELTRADKEDDRVKHIDLLDANDEPVFYTYRHHSEIGSILATVTATAPIYDFVTDDGVEHTVWLISSEETVERLTSLFAGIDTLYVADGHHRSAAASRVRDLRREYDASFSGNEEYNFFLTVIFPDNEMNIMPYNRAVKDLNERTREEYLAEVRKNFQVNPVESLYTPATRHRFGMYLGGEWFELAPLAGSFNENDSVEHLDVSILQNNLLAPVLGIDNPRTNQRIHFVGGIRGTEELERLVDSGDYSVAFSLFPTSIGELMDLADADKIMPPKSTWFEPKLRSGLFVHLLREKL